MMKKVLLVVLTLALATSLSFAQTSGPSNVAGYVKIACGGTVVQQPYATPFGLAFKFWDVDVSGVPQYGVESFRPSDIVGDQAAPGGPIDSDKIVKQQGNQAYRDNTGPEIVWTDPLETGNAGAGEMEPGYAYWYVNKTGSPRDLVLAGEVDNAGNYGTVTIPAPTVGTNYATAYSWRDSREVPVDDFGPGLLSDGFTGDVNAIDSDKIIEQGGGGRQLNYVIGTGWDYGFPTLTPGLAYWIVNKHASDWDYTYVGVPSVPMTGNNGEGNVTSAKKSTTTKTKATVRATSSVKQDAPKTSKKSSKASK